MKKNRLLIFFVIVITWVVAGCNLDLHLPPIQETRESNEYILLNNNHSAGQSFVCEYNNLKGISLLASSAAADLTFKLYEIIENDTKLITEKKYNNFSASVRASFQFVFDEIPNSANRKFYFEVVCLSGDLYLGFAKTDVYSNGCIFKDNKKNDNADLYFKSLHSVKLSTITAQILRKLVADKLFVVLFILFNIIVLILLILLKNKIKFLVEK